MNEQGESGRSPADTRRLGSLGKSAEEILADAYNAFFVMLGFLALIWAVQIANWADGYRLDSRYGIIPKDVTRLPDIFLSPFLHFSWGHIESNSGPLFIFGFLAAYRGIRKFLLVTLMVIITAGLLSWLIQPANSVGVGASGVIFGYFGYVVFRGIFDRHLIDTLVGVVMALSYAYLITIAIPGAPAGIGWQDHLGGLIGGVAGAWLLRERRPREVPASPGPGGGDEPPTRSLPRGTPGNGSGKGSGKSTGSPSELLKELDDMGL
jgi:membrane associated rhomboid family serine protease